MEAIKLEFLQFLSGNIQLIVPVYQRPYSWEKRHCEQLLEDIERVGSSKNKIKHFVGSIVHISYDDPSGPSKLILIDGQQRITTMMLLLLAMEKNLNCADVCGCDLRSYLENDECIGESKYKLILSKRDKDTLLYLLDKSHPEPKEKSKKLIDNFYHFENKLKKATREELESIWLGIKKLRMVEIPLKRGEDNPQLIFESMNSTGKDLSQADLIRNYVFMGVGHEEQNRLYEKYWYPMERGFGKKYDDHFDSFVRFFVSMKIKDAPHEKMVYEKFKRHHGENEYGEDTNGLLEEMLRYSECYRFMALGEEKDPRLNEVFIEIYGMKNYAVFPLLLKLYGYYDNGKLDKTSFEKIVIFLISYMLRRLVCNLRTSSISSVFMGFVKSIDKEVSLEIMESKFACLEGVDRFPDDREFYNCLQMVNVYESKFCRHLLDKLENYGRKEKIQTNEYTVEHIMPKKLSNEWKEDLGENALAVQKKYLHSLGNLTLTGYNSDYGNKPFARKRNDKGGFIESPLQLNGYLKECDTWNEDTIKERAKELAGKAVEVWPRPKDKLREYGYDFKEEKIYTLDSHFKNNPSRHIYNALHDELLRLGSVEMKIHKSYISYELNRIRILDIVARVRHLETSFYAKIDQLIDPDSKIRDVSGIGHAGTGNARVIIDSADDIPYLMDLIKQAFDQKV